MIKTKKQMYIVIGAFALVMLLGAVTYAFFNFLVLQAFILYALSKN